MPQTQLPLGNLGDPSHQGERNFVVTLKNFDDSVSFYNDMESITSAGSINIPERVVECLDRRPLERNTNYALTYEEAVALTKDPRVLAVELSPSERNMRIVQHGWESTSTFTKGLQNPGTDISWGIYRTRCKTNPSNWGNGGTNTLNNPTAISDSSGKNVDVVIVDGGIPYPTTLEFAKNSDGTGYNRSVQYNWFNTIGGNYNYSTLVNSHQAHTTGTVAGNTQGFARDANIYNITYNDSITFVTNFHINKPINPLTGMKNPTVTNNSWGYGYNFTYAQIKPWISSIVHRGVTYTPTSGNASNGTAVWDDAVLAACGIPTQFGNAFPARDAATDANFIDSGAAGVVNVCSAGNSFFFMDVPGGLDYNNYLIAQGATYGGVYYYHRGSSPGAAYSVDNPNNNPICVGAYGAAQTGTMSNGTISKVYGVNGYTTTELLKEDYKSEFSNYGPRVDVYAPGEGILSTITSTSYYSGVATDPRVITLGGQNTIINKFGRDAGTSMAAPHVAGVLACLLEKNPRMNLTQIKEWIKKTSPATLISTNGGATDATDAGFSYNANSTNRIIFHGGTRMPEAEVGGYHPTPFPTQIDKYRPNVGQVYPRKQNLNSFRNASSFEMSANTFSILTGETATIQVNTQNVVDGTQIPYIITAKPIIASSTYNFLYTDINVPLTGTITVSNGVATLPITINTNKRLLLNVRLNMTPTPDVTITTN